MKLVCKKCGGLNVEVKAWIDANNNTNISRCLNWYGDDDDTWCRDCEDHTGIVLEKNFKKK